MGSVLSLRLKAAVVAAFACALMFFGAMSSAYAAGAAVFSAPAPAAGAAVLAKPMWVSVMSDDTAPLISASIKVNGVSAYTQVSYPVGHWQWDDETESDNFVVDDYTIAKVQSYKNSWAMINGTNNVAVTVISASGVSTYNWTFDYVTGTTISTVTPTPASVLPASPAGISASLLSPYTAFTSSMKIDGVVVPTVYTAATKTFTHTPATALTPGSHTVVFTASAAAGSATKTWSFTVRPPMSTGGDCAGCHSAYAASHPRVGCEKCHDKAYAPAGKHGGVVPTVAGCMGDDVDNGVAECHQFDHSGNMGQGQSGFACADCHSAAYPAVAQHADATTVAKHTSTTSCSPCHANSLIDEHAKYPTTSTIKNQCDLCHATGAPQKVKDAIASGTTACVACHSLDTGHEALHAVDRTDSCADCHAGDSLTAVHPLPCASCHESVDPPVVAAIAANDKACVSCHPVTHPDADHTVAGPCSASGCHATDAAVVHAKGPQCSACHAAGVTPSLNCRSCHTTPHQEANHGAASDSCSSCHSTGNLMTVHNDNCMTCHPAPATGKTYTSCSQTGCHVAVHSDVSGHNSDHGEGTSCWDCHSGDGGCISCHTQTDRTPPTTSSDVRTNYTSLAFIRLFPVDTGGSGLRATSYQVDGGAVRSGTTIVIDGPSSGTARHTVEYWSTDMQYNTEVHRFAYVYITAGPPDSNPPSGTMSVNSGATWANSTAATVNSAIADGETGIAAMRVDPGSGVFGAWIDYVPSSPITLPAANGTKTVRAEYRDAGGNILSRSDTIMLDSVLPVGTMSVNNNAPYTNVSTFTINSSVTDALSGVVDMQWYSLGVWSAWKPYSASLTGTFTASIGSRSVTVYYRDNAGNVRQLSDTVTYDPTAPTGTMSVNNNATFATSSAATLNSSVTDVGGSLLTQLRIDPGSGTFGSWVSYTASSPFTLVAGDGVKTVRAEYRDGAGNVLSRSDTITLDTNVPTGTMTIAGGAASTAVTAVDVNSTMTDPTSGLSQMCVDPGTGIFGAWTAYTATYPIALPPGGGVKTVRVQYRDGAGLVASVTDTITFTGDSLDVEPPTGSIVVQGGADYVSTTSVTLSLAATDTGGAGVTHMRFGFDGVVFSAWTPYTTSTIWTIPGGSGAKTVYVQFRDGVGNTSISYWDDINLDAAPPAGTVVIDGGASSVASTTVSLALSASDTGGSGLTHMRVSNDNSSWSAWESYSVSKTWILTSGVGNKTVYVQFRDGAGNISTSASDQIVFSTTGNATLAFLWYGEGSAQLLVTNELGVTIASTSVEGTGESLCWYVDVPAGQVYGMTAYWDDFYYEYSGTSGIYSNSVSINPDGILSPGEIVSWYY